MSVESVWETCPEQETHVSPIRAVPVTVLLDAQTSSMFSPFRKMFSIIPESRNRWRQKYSRKTVVQVVKRACNLRATQMRAKDLVRIIEATRSNTEHDGLNDANIVCLALIPYLLDSNAVVNYKALIVLHTTIRYGATNNVLSYLASSWTSPLRDIHVLNGAYPALEKYASYLDIRIQAYRELQYDVLLLQHGGLSFRDTPTNPERGRLRYLSVRDGLLLALRAVHSIIEALIHCQFFPPGIDNEYAKRALKMTIKDLLSLYPAYDDGILSLLEQHRRISRGEMEHAVDIYRNFHKLAANVDAFLRSTKRQYKNLDLVMPDPKLYEPSALSSPALTRHLRAPPSRESETQSLSLSSATNFSHTEPLPLIHINLDHALANFKTEMSPWKFPEEWLHSEARHVSTIIQALIARSGRQEFEQANFSGSMIYQRLIIYVYGHLMLCKISHEGSLTQFEEKLSTWRSWDWLTTIRHHKAIRDYLTERFRDDLQTGSNPHAENTFKQLLSLDAIGLCAHLAALITKKDQYKQLLAKAQHASYAQAFLDLLQARLDFHIDPEFKHRHVKALIRLARASRLYPECLILQQIHVERDAVAGGTFGDVHKARSQGRNFAVKILRVYQRSDTDALLKEFACEAVTWRQLMHPNVLPFYGVYHLDRNPPRLCLVSPWMDNGNMVQFLVQRGPRIDCVLLSLDVAQGLEYLHSEQIIHGDIKGLNILISQSERACLADFGFARVMRSSPTVMTYMTTDAKAGTLRWQAPELLPEFESTAVGNQTHSSAQSDVYAFGLVCYEMFSGEIPFSEIKNDFQCMIAVKQGRRPSPPTHELARLRGMSNEMWELMEECWAQDAAARLPASEIVKRLRSSSHPEADQRALDDWSWSLPSELLHDTGVHPFASLRGVVGISNFRR